MPKWFLLKPMKLCCTGREKKNQSNISSQWQCSSFQWKLNLMTVQRNKMEILYLLLAAANSAVWGCSAAQRVLHITKGPQEWGAAAPMGPTSLSPRGIIPPSTNKERGIRRWPQNDGDSFHFLQQAAPSTKWVSGRGNQGSQTHSQTTPTFSHLSAQLCDAKCSLWK